MSHSGRGCGAGRSPSPAFSHARCRSKSIPLQRDPPFNSNRSYAEFRASRPKIAFSSNHYRRLYGRDVPHRWAELSERFSDVIDPMIKCGGGPDECKTVLMTTSDRIAKYEGVEKECHDFWIRKRTNLEDLKKPVADAWKSIASDLNLIISMFDQIASKKQ